MLFSHCYLILVSTICIFSIYYYHSSLIKNGCDFYLTGDAVVVFQEFCDKYYTSQISSSKGLIDGGPLYLQCSFSNQCSDYIYQDKLYCILSIGGMTTETDCLNIIYENFNKYSNYLPSLLILILWIITLYRKETHHDILFYFTLVPISFIMVILWKISTCLCLTLSISFLLYSVYSFFPYFASNMVAFIDIDKFRNKSSNISDLTLYDFYEEIDNNNHNNNSIITMNNLYGISTNLNCEKYIESILSSISIDSVDLFYQEGKSYLYLPIKCQIYSTGFFIIDLFSFIHAMNITCLLYTFNSIFSKHNPPESCIFPKIRIPTEYNHYFKKLDICYYGIFSYNFDADKIYTSHKTIVFIHSILFFLYTSTVVNLWFNFTFCLDDVFYLFVIFALFCILLLIIILSFVFVSFNSKGIIRHVLMSCCYMIYLFSLHLVYSYRVLFW